MEDDMLNAGEGVGEEVEQGESHLPPPPEPPITLRRRLGLSSRALKGAPDPESRPSLDEHRDTLLEPGFCLKLKTTLEIKIS